MSTESLRTLEFFRKSLVPVADEVVTVGESSRNNSSASLAEHPSAQATDDLLDAVSRVEGRLSALEAIVEKTFLEVTSKLGLIKEEAKEEACQELQSQMEGVKKEVNRMWRAELSVCNAGQKRLQDELSALFGQVDQIKANDYAEAFADVETSSCDSVQIAHIASGEGQSKPPMYVNPPVAANPPRIGKSAHDRYLERGSSVPVLNGKRLSHLLRTESQAPTATISTRTQTATSPKRSARQSSRSSGFENKELEGTRVVSPLFEPAGFVRQTSAPLDDASPHSAHRHPGKDISDGEGQRMVHLGHNSDELNQLRMTAAKAEKARQVALDMVYRSSVQSTGTPHQSGAQSAGVPHRTVSPLLSSDSKQLVPKLRQHVSSSTREDELLSSRSMAASVCGVLDCNRPPLQSSTSLLGPEKANLTQARLDSRAKITLLEQSLKVEQEELHRAEVPMGSRSLQNTQSREDQASRVGTQYFKPMYGEHDAGRSIPRPIPCSK